MVLLAKRTDASKRTLLGTVVGERLLDAIALGTIFVVVVFGVLSETTLPERPAVPARRHRAGAGGVGAAAVWFLRRHHVVERVREFIRPLADAPQGARWAAPGVVLLAGTFVIWAVEAGVYLAVARAVELDISAMGALYLVALTNLFAMLPAAPGYVGTFDAAVVFGVKAIGGTASLALSYLLLLRFMLFVPITVVGLVVLLTRYGGWSALRSATRASSRPAAPSLRRAGSRRHSSASSASGGTARRRPSPSPRGTPRPPPSRCRAAAADALGARSPASRSRR